MFVCVLTFLLSFCALSMVRPDDTVINCQMTRTFACSGQNRQKAHTRQRRYGRGGHEWRDMFQPKRRRNGMIRSTNQCRSDHRCPHMHKHTHRNGDQVFLTEKYISASTESSISGCVQLLLLQGTRTQSATNVASNHSYFLCIPLVKRKCYLDSLFRIHNEQLIGS